MTRKEAVNWIINITADIGKAEHRELWHYEQALSEIKDMLEMDYSMDEWCSSCKEYDSEKHCCPRFNKVIRATVQEMEKPHWIPVTERLPEEYGWHTVTTDDGGVTYRWYSTVHGWETHKDNVIAWMPLPEPYKGEHERTDS